MDKSVVVVEATQAHVEQLAPRLRQTDALEMRRASGLSAFDGLKRAVDVSFSCHAVIVNGQVEAIMGVARAGVMATTGCPWLLMAETAPDHKDVFRDLVPKVIEYWQSLFDHLENWVDAENKIALRWLKRIGFTLDAEPVPYGRAQTPFYRFEWRGYV